jgi:hypothetical protein
MPKSSIQCGQRSMEQSVTSSNLLTGDSIMAQATKNLITDIVGKTVMVTMGCTGDDLQRAIKTSKSGTGWWPYIGETGTVVAAAYSQQDGFKIVLDLGGRLIDGWLTHVSLVSAKPQFTRFTEQDWNSYSGAENFDNGDEPLICSGATIKHGEQSLEAEIVVDANGVEVLVGDSGGLGWRGEDAANVLHYLLTAGEINTAELVRLGMKEISE